MQQTLSLPSIKQILAFLERSIPSPSHRNRVPVFLSTHTLRRLGSPPYFCQYEFLISLEKYRKYGEQVARSATNHISRIGGIPVPLAVAPVQCCEVPPCIHSARAKRGHHTSRWWWRIRFEGVATTIKDFYNGYKMANACIVRPGCALTGSTQPTRPRNLYGGQLCWKLLRAGRVSTNALLANVSL